MDSSSLAAQLAALGYPGLRYLRPRLRKKNPAEVLLMALAQENLESRLLEALPWLLVKYPEVDVEWLVSRAKLVELQNRLGFVVSVARGLSLRTDSRNKVRDCVLAVLESKLEHCALAREDTLCQGSLTDAEVRWLRENRSREAARWNLLTNWQLHHFRYAK